jgi:hypothetical protein
MPNYNKASQMPKYIEKLVCIVCSAEMNTQESMEGHIVLKHEKELADKGTKGTGELYYTLKHDPEYQKIMKAKHQSTKPEKIIIID